MNSRAHVNNFHKSYFKFKNGVGPSPKSINPDNVANFNTVLGANVGFKSDEFKLNPYK